MIKDKKFNIKNYIMTTIIILSAVIAILLCYIFILQKKYNIICKQTLPQKVEENNSIKEELSSLKTEKNNTKNILFNFIKNKELKQLFFDYLDEQNKSEFNCQYFFSSKSYEFRRKIKQDFNEETKERKYPPYGYVDEN